MEYTSSGLEASISESPVILPRSPRYRCGLYLGYLIVCRNLDAATRSGRDRLDFLFFTLLSLAPPKKSPFSYAFAITPNDTLAHFAFGILD